VSKLYEIVGIGLAVVGAVGGLLSPQKKHPVLRPLLVGVCLTIGVVLAFMTFLRNDERSPAAGQAARGESSSEQNATVGGSGNSTGVSQNQQGGQTGGTINNNGSH
jgi:hypothetical protein